MVMKKHLPIGLGILLLVLIACDPNASTSKNHSKIDKETQRQNDIAAIEDSINNSHAKRASEHDDVCPKLLQNEVGSQNIQRSAEVMVDDYCDYYLYLQSGQTLTVTVNDSRIEALLIVPKLHDFANGSYHVNSYDKHVVRLSYNGATYKPERLRYDVSISVQN